MTEVQIAQPVVDLCARPSGRRERQMLLGHRAEVLAQAEGWSQLRAALDGYEGWVPDAALKPAEPVTHVVSVPATHVYERGDFKSPDLLSLSLGTQVLVTAQEGRFTTTPLGYIPAAHLTPLNQHVADPVTVAESLLGTPYLWGGNSRFGIDCSGLVQIACQRAGIACPGDSGPQEAQLGQRLPEGTPYQRGDLLFWKGHVAWVRDPETLLHANVYAMAVALEPLSAAIARIKDQGDGPVTAHKRLV